MREKGNGEGALKLDAIFFISVLTMATVGFSILTIINPSKIKIL